MRLSFTQESDFRQHRDFGQKISATFEFIGAHWRGLGRALLFLVLPAALLQGILTGLVQQQMLTSAFPTARTGGLSRLAMLSNMGQSPFYWVSIAVGALFVTLLVLTVYGYMACCLRPTPSAEPIAVAEVWAVVRAQLLSSFLSYFGIVALVTLAFVLLIVPGIYLAVVLSIFYVVKVMEGPGFTETMSRCRQLVRGKWWSTCGLLFVMLLLLGVGVAVIGAVVGGLGVAIGGALGWLQSGEDTSPTSLFMVVATTLGGVFNLLIYPPLLIALAFQYFNLVERQEAVGLRQLVNQLGQPPAAVQNAAYRPDEEGEY